MVSGEAGPLPQTNPVKVVPNQGDMLAAGKTRQTVSKTSAIILVLAIGFHSLFEGIAFGLQKEVESAG